ncbi:hypothetical protein A2833_00860 [Candidatus Azambacteria bacterium RIFCSPHIGHO2_01_FULL_44_55]|uniref:Uncharacterized protein n=1 Tax=Candidatus Azambacteria bacterium RIFCSPLOWO2_02_FULL_44_14 TaxID=1797306 RepID=A0A1F5CA59_9BACT|nr:MAG: hypothetical protein A3A18_00310 [Candidatus Azambacteria bacterium RIFCSPLOWO2_01_FULL_44_84]OGD33559.1 MAG: hypothetical protein A3C78_03595 [Candidatus Azambacteria bacterium RIFCSPHIGHO2_02_FULL_45_18]OGD39725.1 MAG: hypothetical protein A3I30_00640 [Candidatus Azambacteria bacterium RIFCSPLOWO2_02_FULL_44_14]OGD41665.1 MAG: hypothetical protein A2833_00860 [Candidatus Azambacteria bacterium RIFCSPHIGHO2_01_FULL_44_55]OGD49775.1 MAG: hypothetical protein A2608_02490 [Candidatus Azam
MVGRLALNQKIGVRFPARQQANFNNLFIKIYLLFGGKSDPGRGRETGVSRGGNSERSEC